MGILVISGGGGWWVNSFEDERKHWGYLDDEVNLSLCFLFFHINMGWCMEMIQCSYKSHRSLFTFYWWTQPLCVTQKFTTQSRCPRRLHSCWGVWTWSWGYNERIQEDNLIKHVLMALGFNMHDLSVLSYPEKNSFNISSQIKTHTPRNTLEMLVFFFFPRKFFFQHI